MKIRKSDERQCQDRKKKRRKRLISALIFIVLALLTLHIVFSGTDRENVFGIIFSMNKFYLFCGMLGAVGYVVIEGIIIWYMLRGLHGKSSLIKCIKYGFVGFFFSGITPSATGGQPMQLYYMKKDGNKLADSTAVLLMVALVYKIVVVFYAMGILVLKHQRLREYMDHYYPLYIIGMILNFLIIVLILLTIAIPNTIKKLLGLLLRFLVYIKIMKPDSNRADKAYEFIDSYHNAALYIKNSRGKALAIIMLAFVQRMISFLVTYFVYRGFGLSDISWITIVGIQAAIYISSNLMPLPGAQGITELIYKCAFAGIFTKQFLIPSLVVTRTLDFYFLLAISAVIIGIGFVVTRLTSLRLSQS